MQTEEKKYVLLNDKIVNILFTSKETIRYVEAIVAGALNLPFEDIHGKLELRTPRVNSNVNVQYSVSDSVYETDDIIINIEVNYGNYENTDIKNLKYVFHLFLNQTKINKRIKDIKPIYQININSYDKFGKGEFIYTSHICDDKYGIIRNKELIFLDISMDILDKLDYTLVKKGTKYSLEKMLYIIVCNDKKRKEELYINNDIMKEVEEKISALTEDFDKELYYDREQMWKDYSFEQGAKQRNVEIAKSMLKDALSIETIIKYTGLSEKEINNLKNN